jgi:hypothetical protein
MQTDQYKQDVARGEIGSDELRERLLAVLELTEQQQQTIQEQRQRIAELERRVEELEAELGRKPTARLDEEYSLQSEEQREARKFSKPRKQKSDRRGWRRTQDKLDQATRHEHVSPDGSAPDVTVFSVEMLDLPEKKAVLLHV